MVEERRPGGFPREDKDSVLKRLEERLSRSAERGSAGEPDEAVGRYPLVDEIGRGGMAVVYKVRDRELRRSLAMKVLFGDGPQEGTPASTLDSSRRGRFLEEAQLTGQLEHPGIVPVHEMGLDAAGRLYFTMRLVRGKTLTRVIESVREADGEWSLTRALSVILKVCEAVAYAHSKRVLHRDLKPANVMVGRFGETYVMDWGLAKFLGRDEELPDLDPGASLVTSTRHDEAEREPDSPLRTLVGDVVGTPAYMPPEQALGKLEELSEGADIYSVGAMLYHLLCGHAPYLQGGPPRSASEVLQHLLAGPPAPVAERNREVPAELVAICEKAMARERERRYEDMLAMAADLQAYLEGRVVAAYETGSVAEFRKWVQRNRGMAASLAAAIVLAIGGLLAVGIVQNRNQEALGQKNQELERTNLALADANEEASAARDAALASEERALENARVAEANAREAEENAREAHWQSAVANLSAAKASLDLGTAGPALSHLNATPREHRGWEWEHLSLVASAFLDEVGTHDSFIWATAFSPDGRTLASGSGPFEDIGRDDRSLRLWDATTFEERAKIELDESAVSLAYSAGGGELAVTTKNNTLYLIDVQSGREILRRPGFAAVVAFDPVEPILAGMGRSPGSAGVGEVFLWDLVSDQILWRAPVPAAANILRFSRDGSRLFAGLQNFEVLAWDREGRQAGRWDASLEGQRPATTYMNGALSLDLSPVDGSLLVGNSGGGLKLFGPDGAVRTVFRGHKAPVLGARFTLAGAGAVSASGDGTLRFWRMDGSAFEILAGHSGGILTLDLSPAKDRILTGGFDGTLRMWDALPGVGSARLESRGGSGDVFPTKRINFSPDGLRVVWQRDPRRVHMTDVWSGETLALPRHPANLAGSFFTSNERLATVDRAGTIRQWDATRGELIASRSLGVPTVYARGEQGGSRVAITHGPAGAALWVVDVESGATLLDLPGHTLPILTVKFDREGKRLATGGQDGQVFVWDLEDGEEIARTQIGTIVSGLSFSPARSELAIVTADLELSRVWKWNYAEDELSNLQSLEPPSAVAYMPDGARLVTGGWDGTVTVLEPDRGEILRLTPHQNPVIGLGVSPDGARLVTQSLMGTLNLLETRPLSEREEARGRARNRLLYRDAATGLVDELFANRLLRIEVLEALERAPDLTPGLRRAAISLALERYQDPAQVMEQAYQEARRTDRTPDEVSRALRAAEWAVALWPDSGDLQLGLGVARYRMGRWEEALDPLSRAYQGGLQSGAGSPRSAAVLGLTLWRLDQRERALELFGEARRYLRSLQPGSAAALETEAFLQEAAQLGAE